MADPDLTPENDPEPYVLAHAAPASDAEPEPLDTGPHVPAHAAPEPEPEEPSTHAAEEPNKKADKRIVVAIVVIVALVALLAAVAVGTYLYVNRDTSDAGAVIVSLDTSDMSEEEVKDYLDRIVEENKMTITCATEPVLSVSDDGTVYLAVNVVNVVDNSFDQRFVLIQEDEDGQEQVLYESGIISPGEMVGTIEADGVQTGSAIIEIYAVVDGEDHGNPTRVSVEIVSDDSADSADESDGSADESEDSDTSDSEGE